MRFLARYTVGKHKLALTEAEDSDILIYVKKIEVALFMSRISDASGAVDEIRKEQCRKKACPAARFLGHGVNNDMTVIKRMESYRFEEILQRGDTSRVSPLLLAG